MSRTKKLIKNTIWDLGYYFIVIFLGFLAPRYIILIYGSEVNGLSSVITQILNVILLLQAGATTAAIYLLYKPIADNDLLEISKNILSTEKFFKKISYLFGVIMLIASVITTVFIHSDIDSKFIFLAFIIMGLKSFLDLFFTSKYRVVFTAFQEKYIISIATLIEQIIYYALVFVTLYVKMHFIFIYIWFFIGCVVRIIYLEHNYKKYRKMLPRYEGEVSSKIKGRSYALANEVAHSLVSSSVLIILSLFYGLKEASVYAIYAMATQAIGLVGASLYSSFAPSFGNLVAAESKETTRQVLGLFQFIYVMMNSVMFYCMIVLIAPFAKIYTSGATDINYVNVMLASIMGISSIFSAYRIPYNIVVSACGYFKETWKQPVLCVPISLFISIALGRLDYSFIILGPASFYLINFLYQHFRIRSIAPYLISEDIFLMFGISILGFFISVTVSFWIPMPDGIVSWFIYLAICIVVFSGYIVVASLLFVHKEAMGAFEYIISHFLRRNHSA